MVLCNLEFLFEVFNLNIIVVNGPQLINISIMYIENYIIISKVTYHFELILMNFKALLK
jgi:hypothetical protein